MNTVTTLNPTVKPTTKPTSEPRVNHGDNVYYQNCTATKTAGVAPLHDGDPGYRSALDRDHEGVACEYNWISGGCRVKGIVDRFEGELVVIEVEVVTKDILKLILIPLLK